MGGNRIDRYEAVGYLNQATASVVDAANIFNNDVSTKLYGISQQVVAAAGTPMYQAYDNLFIKIMNFIIDFESKMTNLDDAILNAINSGGSAVGELVTRQQGTFPSTVKLGNPYTSNKVGVDNYSNAAQAVTDFKSAVTSASLAIREAQTNYRRIQTMDGTFSQLQEAAGNASSKLNEISEEWNANVDNFENTFLDYLDAQASHSSETTAEVQSAVTSMKFSLDYSELPLTR